MNKPASFHEIQPEVQSAFQAAIREGIAAADAARLAPFEPVAEWLASWGTVNELPMPK